jgi:hypothetical protein
METGPRFAAFFAPLGPIQFEIHSEPERASRKADYGLIFAMYVTPGKCAKCASQVKRSAPCYSAVA